MEELVLARDVEKLETGTDLSITLVPDYPSVDNLNEKLEDVLADGDHQGELSVIGVTDFIKTIDAYEQENRKDVQVGAIGSLPRKTRSCSTRTGTAAKRRWIISSGNTVQS